LAFNIEPIFMKHNSSFIKKNPILAGLILGGATILMVWWLIPENQNTTSVDRDQLTQAFDSAYAAEIEASGKVHEFDLTADETTLSLLEGVESEGFAYNDQVPGPVWRIEKGDTLKINFKNELSQETTIHFHGIRVPNAMDGVPGVTQDPIEPGESFIYEFTPKDAGTYWFHPHVRSSEQIEKGLYGVIIVEDPEEPEYSQDKVWVIDDWRLNRDGTLDTRFNTGHDLMHDGRWGNLITVNGGMEESLVVQPGERIRLRLVNVSNGRVHELDFDNLEASVIAVDGMLAKESFNANGFELAPGNRIDVDIIIPQDAAGQEFAISDKFILGRSNTLGVLKVEGESVSTPNFESPNNPNIPDWSGGENLEPDKIFDLNAISGMGPLGMAWTLNAKAYPNYDPLTLKKGEFQTIEFNNKTARLHPMHLHGQFFKVISRNGKPVDEPYFRDTVLVHANETLAVGLVPLDEGEWANHCHILEHAEAGMMSIITVE